MDVKPDTVADKCWDNGFYKPAADCSVGDCECDRLCEQIRVQNENAGLYDHLTDERTVEDHG